MALTKSEILAAIKERRGPAEEMDVPEWGGSIYIRRMDVSDLKSTGMLDGGENVAISMMVACICDEDGRRLFSKKDINALAKTEFQVALRVFTRVAHTNNLSSDELEAAVQSFGEAQDDETSSVSA